MNRFAFSLLFILALAVTASSQVTTQNARRTPTGHGAPSGACLTGPPFGSDYTDIDTTLPTIYKCKSGVWTITAGGVAEAPADGTSDVLAWNFNGVVLPPGLSVTAHFWWTEI